MSRGTNRGAHDRLSALDVFVIGILGTGLLFVIGFILLK